MPKVFMGKETVFGNYHRDWMIFGYCKLGRQKINCMHSKGLLNTETFQKTMYSVNFFDYFKKFTIAKFYSFQFCKS